MADIKISELTEATSVTTNDYLIIDNGETTKKVKADLVGSIKSFVGMTVSGSNLANLTVLKNIYGADTSWELIDFTNQVKHTLMNTMAVPMDYHVGSQNYYRNRASTYSEIGYVEISYPITINFNGTFYRLPSNGSNTWGAIQEDSNTIDFSKYPVMVEYAGAFDPQIIPVWYCYTQTSGTYNIGLYLFGSYADLSNDLSSSVNWNVIPIYTWRRTA